jgi:predicted dienelactone hydrolase
MRPLEILIPDLLAVHLLWRHPRPLVVRYLPTVAVFVILIHFLVEGYRWQMIPLYVLTALLEISALVKIKTAADWKPLGSIMTLRLAQGGALLLVAVSTALPIVLPVPAIPAPDGPYKVGTRIYELTDSSRKELYSGKDEARRFQIQVWYPSEPGPSDQRAPWMHHADVFAPSIATYIKLPSFFLDHLALVKIPAYENSKVADPDQGFPIILFSHGWNGFNAQNTGQALQLASHGYVVVGVQHTYGAVVTVFDDGTIAKNNPAALPMDAPDEEYTAAAQTLAKQWSGDLGYALDFLTEENSHANSPFFKRLNLALVGVYGHSTGGGAAIQFCATDNRCKALFGEDPFMRTVSTEVLESGVIQPAFFMFSQRWHDDVNSLNNRQFKPFFEKSHEAFCAVYIEGTAHYDFSDLPLLSPLAPKLGLKGPINGKRVITIVDDYLLSFFDMTLKGDVSELFNTTYVRYKEVKPLY